MIIINIICKNEFSCIAIFKTKSLFYIKPKHKKATQNTKIKINFLLLACFVTPSVKLCAQTVTKAVPTWGILKKWSLRRTGRTCHTGRPDGTPACTGVAPWTCNLRGGLRAPEPCVPCLSPRLSRNQALSAAPRWTQQPLLAVRHGESALCRTGEVTTTF